MILLNDPDKVTDHDPTYAHAHTHTHICTHVQLYALTNVRTYTRTRQDDKAMLDAKIQLNDPYFRLLLLVFSRPYE